MADIQFKRFDSCQTVQQLKEELNSVCKEESNYDYLIDSKCCSDGEFIHKPTGTILPYHRVILEISAHALHDLGISCTNVESLLELLSTVDASSETIVDIWRLLYGRNMFHHLQTYYEDGTAPLCRAEDGYKPITCSTFLTNLMPSIRIWNAFRTLTPSLSVWVTEFANELSTLLWNRSMYYATLNRNFESIEWKLDIADAIQEFIDCIVKSNTKLGSCSLHVLRSLYCLSSCVLPTDKASRRIVFNWFASIPDIDQDGVIYITSCPFSTTFKYVQIDRDESFENPFAIFENRILQLNNAHNWFAVQDYKTILVTEVNKFYEALRMPTNFKIGIKGKPLSTYSVHDYVMVRWKYFERMMASGMEECSQRILELPEDFSAPVLRSIIATLYCFNRTYTSSHPDFYSAMEREDYEFALESAEEYNLARVIPEFPEEPIPMSPIEKRFMSFLKYCYKSLARINGDDQNSDEPAIETKEESAFINFIPVASNPADANTIWLTGQQRPTYGNGRPVVDILGDDWN